ncbi:Os03g0731650 [Oryza sativa Japonica Group]|uniref:Os03g0731650 protein n=1 Tax=Oryza sativa subsp. japonica TaxID=39947 RepID=A0A0N7KHZ9_ORYSJ|nr:Os03g0731650 [Oryza sativa Japonica Group]
MGAREVEAEKDEAGDLSLSGHSRRGAPTTGRWWPLDPGCSGRIWRGGDGESDGSSWRRGGRQQRWRGGRRRRQARAAPTDGACRHRSMVLAGGGDGVGKEREGGCGDPCAATARFSAAVSPRSAVAGSRGWPAVVRRWWSRQLAVVTTADDADGGLGGDVADGDSEAAAGSGGCSRRRWLASVAAATAADLPAAVAVEALAMSVDVGRWWQQVEVHGEDGDDEVARRSTTAAVVVVAVIAVTGGMVASDG